MVAAHEFGWTGAGQCTHHVDILAPVVEQLRSVNATRVLDIGSGNGALTHALREAGFDMVGIEPDRDGIELARRGGGDFRQISVYDEPAGLGEFDAVLCAEVIEHLFRPSAVPQFAAQVLPAGQPLIITTPYHGFVKNLLIAATNGWDRHLEPLHDGGHIKFFSRRTLEELLEQHGFEPVRFQGGGRLPYLWRSMVITSLRR